jgi:hypothetical protein
VWVVAGTGRVMADGTWPAIIERAERTAAVDPVRSQLVDRLVGSAGPEPWADGRRRGTMADVPELRR